MDQETENQELNGVVQAVLFSNEENGYTVLRVRDENDQIQTVVGCFPYPAPGEAITASGSWVTHQTYGRQFRADFAQRILPVSEDTIYDYLAGGAVKGIGPTMAGWIVNEFGEKALEVLEHSPEKLAKIKGISISKAHEFSEIYRKQTSMRTLVEYICSFSCRPILAVRMFRFYGDQAIGILRTDPYILTASHIGGSFQESDNMALELGFEMDSRERIRAGAIFELNHNLNNGHCFLPEEALIDATCRLLSVEKDPVANCVAELIETGEIIKEELNGTAACYLPALYQAETYIARRLAAMVRNRPPAAADPADMLEQIERKNGIHYAPAQKAALTMAIANRVCIITGGPGTGKSTVTRAILDLFNACGYETLLTAPTGRAAKRLEEITGHEASTVHRLLGARFGEDGEQVLFEKNEEDPLSCDAVILDESSMVDMLLLEALLRALPEKARLILVGDTDQLPPVGPGNVFRGIIDSGCFQTVRLSEIFRQANDSLIVYNAHQINDGQVPDFSKNQAGFFRLKRYDAAGSVETILELCSVRLPERMHLKPDEIQVLSPTRRGEMGTIELNRRLQQVLNPADGQKVEKLYGETTFREGDRVMQIRNNYDILWHNAEETAAGNGIYNGDIGIIRKIDTANEVFTIDFDGKIADYSFSGLNEIDHAWAITVHKSQGCEFPAVVFALSPSSKKLLTRSILYTGITRAKELLILVGDDNVARAMIANSKLSSRFTFLKLRIKRCFEN